MFKCRLLAPTLNYQNQRVVIQAEVIEGNFRQFYDNNDTDALYSVDVKRWRNRRSMDANSYFHVLISKIAEAANIEVSKAEVKNRMLSLYGQLEIIDNKPVYLIVPEDVPVEQWEELHLRPTSQTKELNGVTYRVYMQIRGSHTYDSKEMSTLINGTIQEAKDAGLSEAEIMSTKDKEMLEQKYGVKINESL